MISLSYISEAAVDHVCIGARLARDPDCASHFRHTRLFGDRSYASLPDEPQDAIVHRFTALLQYLVRHDPSAQRQRHLRDGEPDWSRIALAGQSQGGGMAAYLAQRMHVTRVVDFSGGWDRSRPDWIAS